MQALVVREPFPRRNLLLLHSAGSVAAAGYGRPIQLCLSSTGTFCFQRFGVESTDLGGNVKPKEQRSLENES